MDFSPQNSLAEQRPRLKSTIHSGVMGARSDLQYSYLAFPEEFFGFVPLLRSDFGGRFLVSQPCEIRAKGTLWPRRIGTGDQEAVEALHLPVKSKGAAPSMSNILPPY